MQIWKEFSFDHPFLFCFLYLVEPKYVMILNAGHHLLNSISQFMRIVVGTITKCGPHIPCSIARWASSAIVWIVFPSPISSARIQFISLLCKVDIQYTPSSWYSLKGNLIRREGMMTLSSCKPIYLASGVRWTSIITGTLEVCDTCKLSRDISL